MSEVTELQAKMLVVPDLVMPEPAQTITLYGFGALSIVLAMVAIRMSIRYKDWTPLAFLIAGSCVAFTTEALSDFLCHFTHAQIGAVVLYTAYSRVVPLHVFFIFSLYFGAWYMYAYPRMLAGRMGGRFLWKAYFVSIVLAYLFEVIPTHLGMWRYFEPQPIWFWKGTLPLPFAFLNSFCIIYAVVLLDKLRSIPGNWKFSVMLIVGPIGPIMAHVAAGTPYYWTLNAGLPQWGIDLGGIAAMCTSTLGIWLLIQLGYPVPQKRSFSVE
jgi:hypothetical protein